MTTDCFAQVYDRLVNAGYEPTATTYTALISSYGKAGRLDEALGVFDKMVCTSNAHGNPRQITNHRSSPCSARIARLPERSLHDVFSCPPNPFQNQNPRWSDMPAKAIHFMLANAAPGWYFCNWLGLGHRVRLPTNLPFLILCLSVHIKHTSHASLIPSGTLPTVPGASQRGDWMQSVHDNSDCIRQAASSPRVGHIFAHRAAHSRSFSFLDCWQNSLPKNVHVDCVVPLATVSSKLAHHARQQNGGKQTCRSAQSVSAT